MKIAVILGAIIALALSLGQTSNPDKQAKAGQPLDAFRVETNLVLLRFHVIHKRGYTVGLGPEDFQVYEDGVRQKIAVFDGPELSARRLPIELILLIDNSGTVEGLMDHSSFVRTLLAGLHEKVNVSVYSFSHELRSLAPPTRDLPILVKALKEALGPPGLATRLYESVEAVCLEAATSEASAVQTMLIFSDGLADSVARRKQAVEAALRRGIKLYPVLIGRSDARQDEAFAPGDLFARLGEETGGRSFVSLRPVHSTLRTILETVTTDIRTEYIAGYHTPAKSGSGKHKARIQLMDRNFGAVRGGEREFLR